MEVNTGFDTTSNVYRWIDTGIVFDNGTIRIYKIIDQGWVLRVLSSDKYLSERKFLF